MSHIFCRCGYLPRTIDQVEAKVGSVYVRHLSAAASDPAFYYTICQAVGFRWGWSRTVCAADVAQTIDGIPMCKRHARIATCLLPHDARSVRRRWMDRTERYEKMPVVLTDGGREAAGLGHVRSDCVYRAIAIASRIPYRTVAEDLFRLGANRRMNGVPGFIYRPFLAAMGWCITKPRGVYLRKGMLPMGRLIVYVPGHLLAVIDGTIYDTFDSSMHGTRRVKAYYTSPAEGGGQ